MTKFNRLPSLYRLFTHLISRDLILGSFHPANPMYQSSQRRFGIILTPLVLLAYRMGYLFFFHPPNPIFSTFFSTFFSSVSIFSSKNLLPPPNSTISNAAMSISNIDLQRNTNPVTMNAFITLLSFPVKILAIFSICSLLYVTLWVLHLFLLSAASKNLLEWNNGYYNPYKYLTPSKDDSSFEEGNGMSSKEVTHPLYPLYQEMLNNGVSSTYIDGLFGKNINGGTNMRDEYELYQLSQLNGSKGAEPPLNSLHQQGQGPSYLSLLAMQQRYQQELERNKTNNEKGSKSGEKNNDDKKPPLYLDNTVRFGMYSNKIPL